MKTQGVWTKQQESPTIDWMEMQKMSAFLYPKFRFIQPEQQAPTNIPTNKTLPKLDSISFEIYHSSTKIGKSRDNVRISPASAE